MENLPIYKLVIDDNEELGVEFVALVDQPAIETNWHAFKEHELVIKPKAGESKDEYVSRCVGEEINNGMDKDQAVAVCYAKSKEHFAVEKISFDYDETLNTERGKELAKRKISEGFTVYIISARNDAESMFSTADELGIPHSRVYATGSNKDKVEKVKELGIKTHYDNNVDVVNELSGVGHKFKFFADKERRMISGALMIADLPIYRKDESGEYYVVFDKEQIEKIAQRFFKKGYSHNVNMMHDPERQVNGVYMVESFIIDKTRGIKTPEGYPTLTEGSWFGTFKVDNNEVWNDFIKTGVFKGFSVEGAFAQRKVKDAPVSIIEQLADRIHNLRKKVSEIAIK
jgi:hypothetical protein